MAPIVAASSAMLTARTAAYLVGFALGSIGVTWPIVVTLVTIAGIFGGTTPECDAYRAEIERIRLANEAAALAAAPAIAAWKVAYDAWLSDSSAYYASKPYCLQYGEITFASCHRGCATSTYYICMVYPAPYPVSPPPYPVVPYIEYPSTCTPPDCPISRKVWVQVIWASPSEFASQPKGCFLIAYSYDRAEGVKIQYNPFEIPEPFLKSRAKSPDLVAGNRFTKLEDSDWKDFETVKGWDKAYWRAEDTDPECRGWRPGWSHKVK
jgi:hypothetical protein